MDGLLLKFLPGPQGVQEPSFWELFAPFRAESERLFWCMEHQPWFGAPDEWMEDENVVVPFDGDESTEVKLWAPGSLARYADRFVEEYLSFWGIGTEAGPELLATHFVSTAWSRREQFRARHAQIWFNYRDSTCWEVYARDPRLLAELRAAAELQDSVAVYPSRIGHREAAFRTAGLTL